MNNHSVSPACIDARVSTAVTSLASLGQPSCDIGLVLGSGLGAIADDLAIEDAIPYRSIEGFPHSTAPEHKGRLVLGSLEGARVACFQGRFHLYEGWSAQDVALPIYLLKEMGAQVVIITNAAGALNPRLTAGEILLIQDHINLTGSNPLVGPTRSALEPYFPDMSRAYSQSLRELALREAETLGIALTQGVYAAVLGPSFETSAERRYLRQTGADAIGMSTVLEVIAARHCGLEVLAFSAVTNEATGGSEQPEDSEHEVFEVAQQVGRRLTPLLSRIVADLAPRLTR